MVGIVTGLGLGLQNSSAAQLGLNGLLGQTQFGRANEHIYINAATGNLMLQQQDQFLASSSLNINLNRTYNSQGLANDDNGDNWRLGYARSVHNLTGTLNSAGSRIIRTAEDGSALTYTYDSARNLYTAKAAHGGTYTLSYNLGSQQWLWQDGANSLSEYYDANNQGRLTQVKDRNNNQITLQYNSAGLINLIRNSNGDALYVDYDTAPGRQANILQLRSESQSANNIIQTTQKVRYQYDTLNRLTQVIVDLSPEDGGITDGNTYTTTYRYDGNSKRLSSIEQSDTSRLDFSYIQSNGQWRISTVSDIRSSTDTRITHFNYSADGQSTTITDPFGQQTRLIYNGAGQLVQIKGPAVNNQHQQHNYSYDAQGNVTTITDARGNTTVYQYDSNGNRTYERNANGNTIERIYNTDNQLISETSYTIADPDGAGSQRPQGAQTAHYLYDNNGQARFTISAEGRVTEYRYDSAGRLCSQIQYSLAKLSLNGAIPSLNQLSAWVTAQNLSQTQRTDTEYDLRGQISQITRYSEVDAAGNGIASSSGRTHYVYDANGKLLQTINSLGGQTHYTYDGLNRIISQRDAQGNLTTTAYLDAQGQTKVTLANGLTTINQYDRAGNIQSSSMQDAGGLLGATRYQYDQMDQLRCVTNPLGQRSWLLYDEAGQQVGQVDAMGALTEYCYNLAGQKIQTISYTNVVNPELLNSDPLTLTLAQLRPVANSANDRRQFTLYDASGQLAQHIATDGVVTKYQYNGTGQLIQTIQYYTRLSTNQLSALNSGTTETQLSDANIQVTAHANDRYTRQFYDADGLPVATLDAEGYLTEQIYDASGRIAQSIRYATQTNLSLRGTGSLAQLRPASNSADQRIQYLYDAQNQLTGVIDAEGYLTETRYDTVGNTTSQVRYNSKANSGSNIDQVRPSASAEDHVQYYQYNELGQLVRSENQPSGLVTTYQYNNVGNLIHADAKGGVNNQRTELNHYDSQGHLVGQLSAEGAKALLSAQTQEEVDAVWNQWGSSHRYDTSGRLIATTVPDGQAGSGMQTLFYYDQSGRITHTINALGEVNQNNYSSFGELASTRNYAKSIDANVLQTLVGGNSSALNTLLSALQSPEDIITLTGYNQSGQVAFQQNALGQQVRYAYDAFGQLQHRYDPLTGATYLQTDYQYDRRGLLLSQIRDRAGLNISSSQQYDAFGRVISQTNAAGSVTKYQYDRRGSQITQTDPNNKQIQSSYDAFARILTRTDALGNTTTWQHAGNKLTQTSSEGIQTSSTTNAFGETIQITDGNGNKTTYEYNLDGKLLKTTTPAGEVTNEYDSAGQLIKSIDARGIKTYLHYDAIGRVLSRTVDPGGLGLTTQYTYDTLVRTTQVIDPSGQITQTEYDQNGQITRVIQDAGNLNLTTTYRYDEGGRTVAVSTAAGSTAEQTTVYNYDTLGRRISETVDPNGLAISRHYQYDQTDNVISKTDALGNMTRFVYNKLGQLAITIDAIGAVNWNQYDVNGCCATKQLYPL